MTISSIPKIEMNASGHLVILKEGVSLDPLGWTWDASADGGMTWSEHELTDGMFSTADTMPGTLYRAREIFTEKTVFNPLYHEFVFDLSHEISADGGIVKWTLTQPASATQVDPIITETFFDAQDVVAWNTIVSKTQGEQYEEREVRDDGFIETRSYLIDEGFEYIPQSSKTEDGANLKDWQSITTWFDEERGQDVTFTVFDSGLERTEYRDAYGLSEVLLADAADIQSWETLTYLYTDGFRTEQRRLDDTGAQTQYLYGQDLSGNSYVQSMTRSDESEDGEAFIWQTIESRFGADGGKLSTVIGYDNGSTLEDGFENQLLSSRVITDTADTASWETIAFLYGDGVKTERLQLDDNGLQTQSLYGTDSSGEAYVQTKISSDFSEDGGAFIWRTLETNFDEGGEKLTSVLVYDDGRVLADSFDNQLLSSRVITDTADTASWETLTFLYNGGVQTERLQLNDNGIQTQSLYGTDSLGETYVQSILNSDLSENGDAFVWRTIEAQLDEDGEKLTSVLVYDDGRVQEDEYELGVLGSRTITDVEDQFAWYQINEVWDDGIRIARDVMDDAIL